MEKALISRKSLAERWDYDSTRAIVDMEQEGIITRIPEVSSPRYSMEEILKIENLGKEFNPLSPLERRRLEKRIEELEKELNICKEKIEKAKMCLS
jgi:N-acetyl-beta-hexosaminidase